MDASFSIALLLAVLPVSQAVSSLSAVKGEFGASVTLPCDGSAFRGTPEAQLDVLWRTSEGKKVAHYSRRDHSVGIHFEGRVTFPTERIWQGDFSININSVTFRDEDLYECLWNKGPDEIALNDVKLYVLEPPIPKSVSVPVGDSVTLSCYGHINKQAPEESFVQWKKGDELVLMHGSDEVTYGPKYKGRVSVSSERIQKGDFSLSLSVMGVCDSGVYQCSTDQNQNVTSVILELKDYLHYKQVNLTLGMHFSLSLPREPVKVIFSKEGALPKELLCSVDTGGFECDPKYKSRMERKSSTLTMLNMTSDDVGTYVVIHASNCVIIHAYRVYITSSNNNNYNNLMYLWLLLLMVITIAVGCVVICGLAKNKKNKRIKNVKETNLSLETAFLSPQQRSVDPSQYEVNTLESAKKLLTDCRSADVQCQSQSSGSIKILSGTEEDPHPTCIPLSENNTEDDSVVVE